MIATLQGALPSTSQEHNLRFSPKSGYEFTTYKNGDFYNPSVEMVMRGNDNYYSIRFSFGKISVLASQGYDTWIGYYDYKGSRELTRVDYGNYAMG